MEHLRARERESRGHFGTSEQDGVHARAEAKWKPGGDGQDQKSPISAFLARAPVCVCLSRRGALKHALWPFNTHLVRQTDEVGHSGEAETFIIQRRCTKTTELSEGGFMNYKSLRIVAS